MNEKTTTRCHISPGVRLALCVAVGTALSVSNNPATGIAVAAGLWLALTLGARS
jgi:hypothetical protein